MMMTAGAVGRRAAHDHATWLLRHGLVAEAAFDRYAAYGLPQLIAYAYPRAEGEERDLLVDILGWFTVLDDHFDGPAGRDLAGTRDLVTRLLDSLDDPGTRNPRTEEADTRGPAQETDPVAHDPGADEPEGGGLEGGGPDGPRTAADAAKSRSRDARTREARARELRAREERARA
ncbi:hypothetical protein L1885_25585, partial [Streptomyces fuscigenes]|nr:hypothetical protein [Streptomyces fuscigenes]